MTDEPGPDQRASTRSTYSSHGALHAGIVLAKQPSIVGGDDAPGG